MSNQATSTFDKRIEQKVHNRQVWMEQERLVRMLLIEARFRDETGELGYYTAALTTQLGVFAEWD